MKFGTALLLASIGSIIVVGVMTAAPLRPRSEGPPAAPVCTADKFEIANMEARFVEGPNAELTGEVVSHCPGHAALRLEWTQNLPDGTFIRVDVLPSRIIIDPNQRVGFFAYHQMVGGRNQGFTVNIIPLG